MSEEYIYLKDYVKILWKRKRVVILVPIISVVTTAIIVFGFQKAKPLPKIYEQTVTIQNGFLQKSIIEKQESLEMLKLLAGNMGVEAQIEDISNTQMFRVKVKSENPDTLENLVKKYIDSSNLLFNGQKDALNERIEVLNIRKLSQEGALQEIQNLVAELQKDKKSNFQMIDRVLDYKFRIRDIKNCISGIKEEIDGINLQLKNSKQFEIMAPISVHEAAAETDKRKSKLLLSAILGCMGGVLLAFGIENCSVLKK